MNATLAPISDLARTGISDVPPSTPEESQGFDIALAEAVTGQAAGAASATGEPTAPPSEDVTLPAAPLTEPPMPLARATLRDRSGKRVVIDGAARQVPEVGNVAPDTPAATVGKPSRTVPKNEKEKERLHPEPDGKVPGVSAVALLDMRRARFEEVGTTGQPAFAAPDPAPAMPDVRITHRFDPMPILTSSVASASHVPQGSHPSFVLDAGAFQIEAPTDGRSALPEHREAVDRMQAVWPRQAALPPSIMAFAHTHRLGLIGLEVTRVASGVSVDLTPDNEVTRVALVDAQPRLVATIVMAGVPLAETHVGNPPERERRAPRRGPAKIENPENAPPATFPNVIGGLA